MATLIKRSRVEQDEFGPIEIDEQDTSGQKGDMFTKSLTPNAFAAAMKLLGTEQRPLKYDKKTQKVVDV